MILVSTYFWWTLHASEYCASEGAQKLALTVNESLVRELTTYPPKAVCPDLLTGVKFMAYVMRYNHFPH
ncbi:hypothetical protein [Rhizobium leguminosarum]|uniref:hypothetical protein n=1 Tax=Rhizobium leguminosarum TaxID=384 RepID=UPI001C987A40|nr:hypothetical protein [Rhizobium leguminosarum]MBY5701107.1 hypothetical protein [Rhizobium leguminosarum]